MRVDTQTTARHVWTGLVVARNMGIELGKYGLTPLTFAEQRDVIVRINKQWFRDWCPAPACYIDYPLVADDQVYEGGTLAAGISKWIEMVASLRVKVVLIDTAKKWEHRRLLKASLDDTRGFLTLEEVRKLDAAAREQGIKALWAGGISLSQAFEFGKAEVFGIYVTSAASILVPVGKHYRRDPALATVRKPDAPSVARVKLLLESGFLVSRLSAMGMADQAKEMEDAARRLMPLVEAADKSGEAHRETQRQESVVYKLAEDAWRRHLKHHRKG
jgi:hypothetical protein